MAAHFHPLTVRDITRETPDCVSIALEVPESLRKDFSFEPGQSLTFRAQIGGEEVRRSYSLCTAPSDNEWRVAVKQVEGGKFSTYANTELKVNDTLDVMPPSGNFNTPLDPAQAKNYVAFAAGSGITPVISIIKTTLQTEPNSRFTLVYGNRNRGSVLFFEALEALKNKYLGRFTLIHVLSREQTDVALQYGRIDAQKLDELGKLIAYTTQDEYFLCGPEAMIFCVKEYLEKKGVAGKKIHFELFTTPGQKETGATAAEMVTAAVPTSRIHVQVDGRQIEFDLAYSKESILDAALKQGADLPFACKGGVCCTCKARLLEGKVKMDVHWGLEPDEIEKGFILTCQSHPLTEKVVVDFDERG